MEGIIGPVKVAVFAFCPGFDGGRPYPAQALVVSRRLAGTWIGLLALSQLADVATTWFSLTAGRHEDNPFVAAALTRGNFGLYIVIKLLLVAALAIAVRPGPRAAWVGLRFVVVAFSLVAVANLLAAVGA